MEAREISIFGRKVRYWIGGSGKPLVLIHGAWGDAALSWSRVWDELETDYQVIAPDMPGFGASEAPVPISYPQAARVLKSLLDELGLGQAAAVGNSMGASLACYLAGAYPHACEKLVLVDGGQIPVLPAAVRAIFRLPLLSRFFAGMAYRFSFSDAALKRSFARPLDLPQGFLDAIRATARRHAALGARYWLNTAEPARPAMPFTMIWGAADGLIPLARVEAMAAKIPQASLVVIPDAGHMPQVERPVEFTAVLKKVLAALS